MAAMAAMAHEWDKARNPSRVDWWRARCECVTGMDAVDMADAVAAVIDHSWGQRPRPSCLKSTVA